MNVDTIKKVKDIRNAIYNNKLVIFVGAGVSKNSNLPTWGELITKFARLLSYDKCDTCRMRDSACPKKDCQYRYHFSQDEYLKIPQYYYESRGKSVYNRIIRNQLNVTCESNAINDVIFRMLPHHIITTNYDHLLENSKESNARLYSIIREDKDLILNNNTRYIIKMHGDINNIDKIVLKENDYLEYSQNNVLIETYIKSLLIDHVFLFVGYSLNDYNLKLIISWINYLAKEHGSDRLRPRNYIIQSIYKTTQKSIYEQKNLAANNIIAINSDEIPDSILSKAKNISLSDAGKKVYSCLEYILDEKNDYLVEPLENILYEKYKVFDSFNRISFEDLKSVSNIGSVELKSYFLRFYKDEEFDKIKNVLSLSNSKVEYIKQTFIRAGIFELGMHTETSVKLAGQMEDERFGLYLDNNYIELINMLDSSTDLFEKAYYYHICMPQSKNCSSIMSEIEHNNSIISDSIQLIFYKFNKNCLQIHMSYSDSKGHDELNSIIDNLPVKYKEVCGFIKKLHNSSNDNLMKAYTLLEKQENIYLGGKDTLRIGGDNYGHIWDLQGIAYDYYFYFKLNYLMLDFFSDPKVYVQSYLKAILCTYAPEKDLKSESAFWGRGDKLGEYSLNAIDFDIFIKFADEKNLRNWIKHYKVKYIAVQDGVDIVAKFSNLCNSLAMFPNRYFFNYLETFSLLITKMELSIGQLENIILSFSELLKKIKEKNTYYIESINNATKTIVFEYANKDIKHMNSILQTLTESDVIRELKERNYWSYEAIIKTLGKYSDAVVKRNIKKYIKSCVDEKSKARAIYSFRNLLSCRQFGQWKKFLLQKDSGILHDQIFWLVYEKKLPFNDMVFQRFIDIIDKEAEKRLSQPGFRTHPDHLVGAIDSCIILFLMDYPIDIAKLEPCKEHSIFLQFLLDPEHFDYTTVNTTHYMWLNFFMNKRYKDVLIKNKKYILTSELEQQFANQLLTLDQQKIILGQLLTPKELWDYGKNK